MLKTIVAGILSIMLAGCADQTTSVVMPAMPQHLKDCSVDSVMNKSGFSLTIVRCPNSTTSATYRQGKSNTTTVVVDGV